VSEGRRRVAVITGASAGVGTSSPAALDDAAAVRLWRESEALLAKMGFGKENI